MFTFAFAKFEKIINNNIHKPIKEKYYFNESS